MYFLQRKNRYILFSFIVILLLIISFNQSLSSTEVFKSSIPEENSTITKPTSITIYFFTNDGQENFILKDFEVLVNGKDVTSKCKFSQGALRYHPIFPYKIGKNEVKVKVKFNKNYHKYKFNFYYSPYSPIKEIIFNSDKIYYESDQLEVRFKSTPGGIATFSIENVKDNISMEELDKGTYQGTYDVTSKDITTSAKIKCKIKYPDGDTFEKISDKGIAILGSFFVVRIISPKPGQKVGQSFDIIGKTRPNATVKISAGISLENIPVVGNLKTKTGGFVAKADDTGKFTLKFGLPVKVKKAKITLYATAKDAKGNQAIPSMSVLFVE